MKKFMFLLLVLFSSTVSYSFSDIENKYKKSTFTTKVSYYHDKFNGRKTASGEIFSNNLLTAAHKKLPFGTEVKVTNPQNGESVVVRINDRGPYHTERELDLTKAAFKEIANINSGIIAVEYEILN